MQQVPSGAPAPSGVTVVAPRRGERALVWVGFPLVGAGAGWVLKSVAGWVASLPWAPFQGPFTLVASVADQPLALVVALALGVAAGLVLALLAEVDYVTVTIDDDQVTIARGDARETVRRASTGAVFLDGKQLVLLGRATEELARQGGDLPAAERLQDAFLRHGYPWQTAGDPHRHEYQRWVEDHPDLPAGAHALFKARARALEQDDGEDVEQLRAELAGQGIVVRDQGGRQYWRRISAPPDSGF